jgi:hypothetical protein
LAGFCASGLLAFSVVCADADASNSVLVLDIPPPF